MPAYSHDLKNQGSPWQSLKHEGLTKLSTPVDCHHLSYSPAVSLHKMGNLLITPTQPPSMTDLSLASNDEETSFLLKPCKKMLRRAQPQLVLHMPLPCQLRSHCKGQEKLLKGSASMSTCPWWWKLPHTMAWAPVTAGPVPLPPTPSHLRPQSPAEAFLVNLGQKAINQSWIPTPNWWTLPYPEGV